MKIVLAYSGGLDTSVIIKWLINNYGAKVVAFSADLGCVKDLKFIKEKALKIGAKKCYIEDLKDEFVSDYVFPALKADAVYEGKYPLATALGRYIISKRLVEIAQREKADAVAHGCTGKGNDQVRFEVTVGALAPELKIIAPVREWELKTREQEIDYAVKNNIPVPVTKKSPYSIDENVWGRSIESGVLEDAWMEPPEDAYAITNPIGKAPSKPLYLTVAFEKGIPVAINGRKMKGLLLIEKLNSLAGRYGIGRIDSIENRLVGIKSREIYEAPAAVLLHSCHREIESMTLDRDTLHFKETLSRKYSELVYNGLWYSPLKSAIDAFMNKTQETVAGEIRVKLEKGRFSVVGRKSEYSLYKRNLATYDVGDTFDHKSAKGFVDIFGLPLRGIGLRKKRK